MNFLGGSWEVCTEFKKIRKTSGYRPCGARIIFSGREEMCVLRGALRDGGARWGVLRGHDTTPTGELLTKHTHIRQYQMIKSKKPHHPYSARDVIYRNGMMILKFREAKLRLFNQNNN
jgi:hypothetical protein